jgi:PadR family transcriptional regulator, regulatory protein PadR
MNKKMDILRGTLDMLILKTVALAPIHGYGIAVRLKQMSKDILDVRQGSLYPALHRLQKQGLVEAEWLESETGHKAKYYAITKAGRKRLEGETADWETLSTAIDYVLRASE